MNRFERLVDELEKVTSAAEAVLKLDTQTRVVRGVGEVALVGNGGVEGMKTPGLIHFINDSSDNPSPSGLSAAVRLIKMFHPFLQQLKPKDLLREVARKRRLMKVKKGKLRQK